MGGLIFFRKLRWLIGHIISPFVYLFKDKVLLGKNAKFGYSPDLVGDIYIGDYSYISQNCGGSFFGGQSLVIGKYCSIASGVQFMSGSNHDYNMLTTYPTPLLGINHKKIESITIGNDVRIGRNAMILKGITIGTGAVIGAGAVVTKDIPPYAIVVGNPAKVIKYRFDDNTINKLLESKWRDWDIEKIKNNYYLNFIKE